MRYNMLSVDGLQRAGPSMWQKYIFYWLLTESVLTFGITTWYNTLKVIKVASKIIGEQQSTDSCHSLNKEFELLLLPPSHPFDVPFKIVKIILFHTFWQYHMCAVLCISSFQQMEIILDTHTHKNHIWYLWKLWHLHQDFKYSSVSLKNVWLHSMRL